MTSGNLDLIEFAVQLGWNHLWLSIFLWFVFLIVLLIGSRFLPGKIIEINDIDGNLRSYKLNGLWLFLTAMLLVFLLQISGWFSLSTLLSHFIWLFLIANVIAFTLTFILHFSSSKATRSESGLIQNLFFGTQRNPVWFGVDLKLFSYRPSLIGLSVLNISFAVLQYEQLGELSSAMILYQVFTFIYILNYFQFEVGMVHTWDIVSERFGWMLIWGNLVLVPFFYSIVGWFLVHTGEDLSSTQVVLLCLLFVVGFLIFRGSNQQKHRFKQDPKCHIWGQTAETIEGRLLVSGFWGLGRHLNYTGEICVYLAFALTAGATSWLPYLLPLWVISLLVHRARRDERRCSEKYGELWEEYSHRVRFSLIPFVKRGKI